MGSAVKDYFLKKVDFFLTPSLSAKVCRSIDNNVREVGGKVDGADGPQSLLLQLLSGRVTIELGRVLHFKS